ncbi:hypothetical protein LIER_21569 [Lithospermum erythrorhizon]|uniref:Uncharacterized protein n=1 Tax=Lithospermum erythrorhizon TaxID=34254 RepID=A0AAV3QUW1_LITER
MNCFKLPVGTIDTLNSLMKKFFWTGSDKERGIHWKSWSSLCEEKFKGDLGFKDLKCMNLALLAKQGCTITKREASFQGPEDIISIPPSCMQNLDLIRRMDGGVY